jgi:putative membrane protein
MKLFTLTVAAGLAVSASTASAQAVTDPQIAAIVVTANQVDIDAGKVAEARATSADVKRFGQMMVTSHAGVNKQAAELMKQLKVTPERNPTSQSLESGGETNVAHLQKLTGVEFDRAYIDHEVAYRQQVLEAIDTTLIPNARNSELKALLTQVRPAIASHLQHAKTLQASLRPRK